MKIVRTLALAFAVLCLMPLHSSLGQDASPGQEESPPGNDLHRTGTLALNEAWTPPTDTDPATADKKTAEIYFSVHNIGTTGDQITAARTSIARKVDLVGLNGAGQAVPMGAIDLPPKRVTSLYPGGPCIRLSGLQGALSAGARFTLHIEFADAKPIDVPVFVQDANAEQND